MKEAISTNNKPVIRPLFIMGHLICIMFILSCASIAELPSDRPPHGTIDIDDDLIKMVDESGDWVPIAGESTFELTAELGRRLPWTVAGQVLETIDTTQIEEGLHVGDLVRVKGATLKEGTWLAYSIEHAEEQTDPIVFFTGRVDSIAPWVVSGIRLHATDETNFQGHIRRGKLVRVEMRLLSDGTGEILRMAPLSAFTETEDCVTVLATIVTVHGNEIQFLGWPTLTLAENTQIGSSEGEENRVALHPNQLVMVVICPAGDDKIMITQIIVLN